MNFDKQYYVDNKEKIETNVKKKQEIEYVLLGTIKPQRGQFVWEINEETGEILKAEYKRTTVSFDNSMVKEELITKRDCIYIPAINADNAKKKYLKNKEQYHYYAKDPVMKIGYDNN